MSSIRKNHRGGEFQIINQDIVDSNWNGLGMILQVNRTAAMPQTPNGTLIFGWMNLATQNSQGVLALTSGGSQPTFLDAPALVQQPNILMQNWQADNLNVTNISANYQTPIWISAYGPGVAGQIALKLPTDGTAVPLATGQSAQNNALAQYMQLVMSSTTATLGIFAIIGGPTSSGTNGYVIAVNADSNTGPGTDKAPPAGYYATTTGNAYTFQFRWGSSLVYVVNMSPATASGSQVRLRAL